MTTVAVRPLGDALAGLAALAAAMGIGRFAYTPILPFMQGDGGLTVAQSGYVASANYLGYLVGALLAGALPSSAHSAGWLRAGLAASVVTTGAMAVVSGFVPWTALRFAGGVASALTMVFGSTLVLEALARARRAELSAIVYAGVGVGIALSAIGVDAVMRAGGSAPSMWLVLAAMAGALAVWPWVRLHAPSAPHVASTAPAPAAATQRDRRTLRALIVAYGLFGFGYIVTATFVVLMVRSLPDRGIPEALVWLVVGLSAAPSNLLWARAAAKWGWRGALVAAYLLEAAGVALSALATGTLGVFLGAVLLGGTFMGITAVGLVAARTLAGDAGRRAIAFMTAAFGLGQTLGPTVAALAAARSGDFTTGSLVAAAALLAGAVLVSLHRPAEAPRA